MRKVEKQAFLNLVACDITGPGYEISEKSFTVKEVGATAKSQQHSLITFSNPEFLKNPSLALHKGSDDPVITGSLAEDKVMD